MYIIVRIYDTWQLQNYFGFALSIFSIGTQVITSAIWDYLFVLTAGQKGSAVIFFEWVSQTQIHSYHSSEKTGDFSKSVWLEPVDIYIWRRTNTVCIHLSGGKLGFVPNWFLFSKLKFAAVNECQSILCTKTFQKINGAQTAISSELFRISSPAGWSCPKLLKIGYIYIKVWHVTLAWWHCNYNCRHRRRSCNHMSAISSRWFYACYASAFRRRRHYVFGLSVVRPSVRSLKYPLLTCTWVRWSTRRTVTVLRHVRPSGEVSGHLPENAWREWPEILHADVSWPSSELVSLWPQSVNFSNFGANLTLWNGSNLGFPGISRRTHGGNGLKFCTLMYLDHPSELISLWLQSLHFSNFGAILT